MKPENLSTIFGNILIEKIKAYDEIVICGHQNPDGDCIGSICALKSIIELNFPNKIVEASIPDNKGRYKDFGEEEVMGEDFSGKLCIVVDSGAPERIGDSRWETADEVLKIDHHTVESGKEYGDKVLRSEEAPSTTALIYELAKANNLEINKEIAEDLYVGLMTDTVYFSTFSNEERKEYAFDLKHKLEEMGGLDERAIKIWESEINEKKNTTELVEYIKENVQSTTEGIGYIRIDYQTVKDFGLKFYQVANEVDTIKECGFKHAVMIVDYPGETDRVTIRSDEGIAEKIAQKIGGGGHKYAAGAKLAKGVDLKMVMEKCDMAIFEHKMEKALGKGERSDVINEIEKKIGKNNVEMIMKSTLFNMIELRVDDYVKTSSKYVKYNCDLKDVIKNSTPAESNKITESIKYQICKLLKDSFEASDGVVKGEKIDLGLSCETSKNIMIDLKEEGILDKMIDKKDVRLLKIYENMNKEILGEIKESKIEKNKEMTYGAYLEDTFSVDSKFKTEKELMDKIIEKTDERFFIESDDIEQIKNDTKTEIIKEIENEECFEQVLEYHNDEGLDISEAEEILGIFLGDTLNTYEKDIKELIDEREMLKAEVNSLEYEINKMQNEIIKLKEESQTSKAFETTSSKDEMLYNEIVYDEKYCVDYCDEGLFDDNHILKGPEELEHYDSIGEFLIAHPEYKEKFIESIEKHIESFERFGLDKHLKYSIIYDFGYETAKEGKVGISKREEYDRYERSYEPENEDERGEKMLMENF